MYKIEYIIPMDTIASLSYVRNHLPGLVMSLGKKKRRRVVITRYGSASAVLMSPEEVETLEIMADRNLLTSLLKAEEDERAGRLLRHEELFK